MAGQKVAGGPSRAERRRPDPDGVAGRRKESPRTVTAAKQGRFLDELAATCCVTRAAEAAEAPVNSFYHLRRRDPAFREQWQTALMAGYDAVEGQIIRYVLSEAAGAPGSAESGADAGPAVASDGAGGAGSGLKRRFHRGVGEAAAGLPTWVGVAMALLNRHRATVDGTRSPMRRAATTPDRANDMLEKRLDQLSRSIKVPR